MLRYIFWRVLAIFPLALMISFIAFILLELAPSDPAEVALRVNEIVPTPEAIEGMRHELGLDKPFFTRYFLWLMAGFQLDFGTSFLTRTPCYSRDVKGITSNTLASLDGAILYDYFGTAFSIVVCG